MIIERLREDAIIPRYQTKGSVGLDLHSIEATVILPGGSALIGTGLRINLPEGIEGQVRSRSGLAAKNSVFVLNSPGTIDSDYRGEIKIILFNAGKEAFYVKTGDRIAQLVLAPVHIEQELLLDNTREDNGFGSTGL
jgi:dUTP pyrophosphatase